MQNTNKQQWQQDAEDLNSNQNLHQTISHFSWFEWLFAFHLASVMLHGAVKNTPNGRDKDGKKTDALSLSL